MDDVEEQVPRHPRAAPSEARTQDGDPSAESRSDRSDGGSPLHRLRAWRDRIRARPSSNRIYRIVVGVIGGLVVVGGLVAIPFPGPGWLIVFLGLAILGSEFLWAARLNDYAKSKVSAWTRWLVRQALWVRALVALVTLAVVAGLMYVLLALSGVPGFVPDSWALWLGLEP